jgi:CMP-N-acetylneuraminic acid synthetase
MARVVALVPMRHESERVRGKNYRSFAGRPLYHHVIDSLLKCHMVDEVVIDTDSPIIMEDAAKVFPQVTVIERPEHLRAGTVPMNDVLLNSVREVKANFYLQTHSTNPLLLNQTITSALETYIDQFPIFDSLFSVTRIQTRLWDSLARPINHNPAILMRTQDLPPVFEENSCLYIFSPEVLQKRHSRIGERPLMFEIHREESIDIDEEIDFAIAEHLFKEKSRITGESNI